MTSHRTALVTGASRGIGAAIASSLRDNEIFVIGTATTEEGAASIQDVLGAGGKGIVLRVDDDQSVQEALASLSADHEIEVLVNCAGVTRDGLLMRMSEEDWNVVVNTNVNSLYRLCKPLIRSMMRKRWGRIINISSVVGQMGNPGQANYVASKAAIEGFTRSLALEVATRGITVNCVAPGFIDTGMTRALSSAQVEAILDRIPVGRIGTTQDVADVVVFLADERSGYITGQTIHVNGGMYFA